MSVKCHRLAQITDTHLSAGTRDEVHGINTTDSARKVLAAVAAFDPELVVATGDLADNGEPEAYRRLDGLLRELDAPVYAIPGNHDDARTMATMPGVSFVMAPRAELGPWRLHFLDSAIPGRPEGRVGATQLERLTAGLDGQPGLVFVHHQPVAIDSPWIDEMKLADGPKLMQCVAGDPGVAAVCCGHVHQAVTGWAFGVRWLTTPSTCSQAVPRSDEFIDDDLAPGFRWFHLYDNGRWETGVTRVR